jgi:ubiquinone/menaquinone biosynthesis C-methylase UbiE
MKTESSDAKPYDDRQRQQWDRVAAGWQKWWRTIENEAQHVSERLLGLAEVEPGQRILDIATGIGEPALLAASRVGPAGRVIATDISTSMLEIARDRANMSGFTNVEFIESDAERLDFPDSSFDAIVCRWGLSSLANPSDTLVRVRRMLTPNGSFAISVWEERSKLPLMSIATAIARDMFPLPSAPPETAPQSELAEGALERMMIRAGFTDVRAEKINVTLEWPSAEAFSQYFVDVSPVLAALLSDQPSKRQKEYRQRLTEAYRDYAAADGSFQIHNVTICVAGRR